MSKVTENRFCDPPCLWSLLQPSIPLLWLWIEYCHGFVRWQPVITPSQVNRCSAHKYTYRYFWNQVMSLSWCQRCQKQIWMWSSLLVAITATKIPFLWLLINFLSWIYCLCIFNRIWSEDSGFGGLYRTVLHDCYSIIFRSAFGSVSRRLAILHSMCNCAIASSLNHWQSSSFTWTSNRLEQQRVINEIVNFIAKKQTNRKSHWAPKQRERGSCRSAISGITQSYWAGYDA